MNVENGVEAGIEGVIRTTVIVRETDTGKGIENDDVTETETANGATEALETDQRVGTLIETVSVRGKETETEMTAGVKGTTTAPIATMTTDRSEKGMYPILWIL